MNTEFTGAKMALYIGDQLAVILRDDLPGLPYAALWDFPGGGREGEEGPLECALRECHEELGLKVPREAVVWEYAFVEDGQDKWFCVGRLPASAEDDVVFGDEGQRWELMSTQQFLTHPKAIPFLQERLRVYLAQRERDQSSIGTSASHNAD